jgi:hypothetical protein
MRRSLACQHEAVPVLETTTFRLASGVDEASFLRADERVQAAFAYQQPGVVRRTTARSTDGEWLVVTVWETAADADAARARETAAEDVAALDRLVDPATVRHARYAALD